ncbi:baculoviral IAP repeat-containing protein 5.1-like isoform X1 [Poecile atricapillus]|uniref:baculoviral IAP repeat-containing protein 5.1-like isoform X1 n=1 Tax=Poecile atricapillus TaxID=48891 RepID=UPI0027398C85|nr:baculoviral IAP repeat-containing protein 5.1-like isoform X1 [Poecile atricapillus]
METLLQELSSASKLLTDFKEMYEYERRLKTFTKWPFQENCKCTPENMAKAGFIHCPGESEPDVAKCFFCLLELADWEPNDDPWEEHTKRHTCDFLSLPKHFDELTMEEYYMLEMTRLRTFIVQIKNKRMAWTGKDLKDHPVLSSCHGPPIAQGPIQPDLGHFQGWSNNTISAVMEHLLFWIYCSFREEN